MAFIALVINPAPKACWVRKVRIVRSNPFIADVLNVVAHMVRRQNARCLKLHAVRVLPSLYGVRCGPSLLARSTPSDFRASSSFGYRFFVLAQQSGSSCRGLSGPGI